MAVTLAKPIKIQIPESGIICLAPSRLNETWLCNKCRDTMFYRDGRYKCYSCSHIILRVVSLIGYKDLSRAFYKRYRSGGKYHAIHR